jgi:selenocysteine lyase/cysteine desulfurase
MARNHAGAALSREPADVRPASGRWPEIVGPDDFGAVHAADLRGQINLDYAATTPALRAAADAVLRLLPAYGSIHRGGGARSRISTAAYEAARQAVGRFVGIDDEHVVVFVRNTTEAINLVAASLPKSSRILCSPVEHHANLLPWRDHRVDHLPFTSSAEELVEVAASMLQRALAERRPYDVLAVSGASNVTGEVLPVAELAAVAHDAGADVLVDAAQLAPHRRIRVRDLQVDYLALSGHKLYAPFGAGALIVRRDLLRSVPPLLKGGGAVRVVTLDDVAWADLPQRLEAGTPNLLGAVALAAACDELERHGRERLEQLEGELALRLWRGLDAVPGCNTLRGWPAHDDRVAVATFVLADHDPRDVALRLTRDYGVAVRSGLFCAHPFVSHLLATPAETTDRAIRGRTAVDLSLPGAVRASIGVGVQQEDVDTLIAALHDLAGSSETRESGSAPRNQIRPHTQMSGPRSTISS